jgi:hypothetical protein
MVEEVRVGPPVVHQVAALLVVVVLAQIIQR